MQAICPIELCILQPRCYFCFQSLLLYIYDDSMRGGFFFVVVVLLLIYSGKGTSQDRAALFEDYKL